MSKTILTDVDGWTPLIDVIVDDLGLITAGVFGRMWRYCQMSDGVCKASLSKIGAGIKMDKATIMRHAKILVENGYLTDLTPDLRNRPHVYKDTGKAGLRMSITVAHSNATVAESKLKRVSKRDSNNSATENVAGGPKANQIPEILLFRSVTGRYPARSSFPTVVDAISKIRSRLGRDVLPDDISPFLAAWTDKAWNPMNLAWLKEWAVSGVIPQSGTRQTQKTDLVDFQSRLLNWAQQEGQSGAD